MKLDRVTITGGDDSIPPEALVSYSRTYPWVEWGILLSRSQVAVPRFPSIAWVESLAGIAFEEQMALSGHLCGAWVRNLCRGDFSFAVERPTIADAFDRIQLNFHAIAHTVNPDALVAGLKVLRPRNGYILQFDGVNDEIMRTLQDTGIPAAPLFDRSGGKGVLPKEWPPMHPTFEYAGYAGGLSPTNVLDELTRIEAAVGDGDRSRVWIDVETHVRSDNDRLFDLDLVEKFLEAVAPWVRR
jgi:hypothetical protein